MSIRRQILEPLVLLAAICALATAWISLSALRTHESANATSATALQAVQRAADAQTAYDALRELVEDVTDMVVIRDPDETAATFRNGATALRAQIFELRLLTLGPEMTAELDTLGRDAALWMNAAAIVTGVKSSPRLPARHVLEHRATRVAEDFRDLVALVRTKSESLTQSAQDAFLRQVTIAAAAMICMLAGGAALAFQRARRLIQALGGLSGAMERIERGELSVTAPGLDRRDEIGVMARGVESFAKGLRQLTEANVRIEHLAMHDPLTGLPNRRYLNDRLKEMLARRRTAPLAALHVDLDHFKVVNDTRGHAAGDAVLRRATELMQKQLRAGDLIARAGGDEFVIIASEIYDEAGLSQLAERVIAAISQPILHEGATCQVGASVGVAIAEPGATDAERLLRNADIALYAAKNAGRGVWRFYSDALRREVEVKATLAAELREALECDEIEPFFQPQIDAVTGRLSGFEALVRWRHPVDGVRGPSAFLDVAIELGSIDAIGATMLHKSLAALSAWRARGFEAPRIAVNFSQQELREPHFVDNLLHEVLDAGLTPADVAVELLESVLVDDDKATVASNLARLEQYGFPLELDDFGTEHASISNLKRFNVSRIKIDRAFVSGIDHDPEQETIVRALVDLASRLGVESLAEGVETEGERAKLIELGCNYLQGYGIGKPMSFEECGRWIEAHESAALAETG